MSSSRILHVITRLSLGGSSESTIAQVEALAAADYRCALAVGFAESEPDELGRAAARGCRLIDVPTLGRDASPTRDLRAVAQLARIMRETRPALVHTHTSKAGFVGRRRTYRAVRKSFNSCPDGKSGWRGHWCLEVV